MTELEHLYEWYWFACRWNAGSSRRDWREQALRSRLATAAKIADLIERSAA